MNNNQSLVENPYPKYYCPHCSVGVPEDQNYCLLCRATRYKKPEYYAWQEGYKAKAEEESK